MRFVCQMDNALAISINLLIPSIQVAYCSCAVCKSRRICSAVSNSLRDKASSEMFQHDDTFSKSDEFRDDILWNIIIIKMVEQNIQSLVHISNNSFLLRCRRHLLNPFHLAREYLINRLT